MFWQGRYYYNLVEEGGEKHTELQASTTSMCISNLQSVYMDFLSLDGFGPTSFQKRDKHIALYYSVAVVTSGLATQYALHVHHIPSLISAH